MAKTSKSCTLTVNMANECRFKVFKTVLKYEASIRGLTLGQTFSQLVMEAADIGHYPAEVKAQLDEIAETAKRHAAVRTIEAITQEKRRVYGDVA